MTIGIESTVELAKALICTVCICVGEGYSRSTYDGYGIGIIDGEGKVVDDGISLHRTMVWLRFFLWLEQKVPVPTQTSTGQREHGSECNHEKQLQLLSSALQDSAIILKIAGQFPVYVWG